jgi:hypothetical protein
LQKIPRFQQHAGPSISGKKAHAFGREPNALPNSVIY